VVEAVGQDQLAAPLALAGPRISGILNVFSQVLAANRQQSDIFTRAKGRSGTKENERVSRFSYRLRFVYAQFVYMGFKTC
jgi:hypothetical protein